MLPVPGERSEDADNDACTMSNATELIAGLSEDAQRALLAELLEREAVEPPTFPLSFAQQRLWFLDQLSPGSPVYNMPAAVGLSGALDAAILEEALNEIVRRHEVLRTTFRNEPSGAVQVVAPECVLSVPVVDLSGLPAAERESAALRLAASHARLPFDLVRGPLLRFVLLRSGAGEHMALVCMHHIASDAWSIGVLLRELATLYRAFQQGKLSPLPELALQYADYSQWQRDWLSGEVLENELAYWRDRLAGVSTLELPTDRPRPPLQSFAGASLPVSLSRELSQNLLLLGKREKCTPFMVLLAALQALLHRLTGQDDIAVGSPVAGRSRVELGSLIGFFVNTLVLRGDLSGHPTFRELLGRVREMAREAFAHQEVPFEHLVEVLQPKHDPSRTPLFQVVFALQNAPLAAAELPGLKLTPVAVPGGTAKFDLVFVLQETPQGLAGSIEYNTDLFDAATISRWSEHFRVLLEGIVANPDTPVAELPLLAPHERRRLLVAWNQTRSRDPFAACVVDAFETCAARTPQALAIADADGSWTYGELNTRANRLAWHLIDAGVGPEVLVGVCLERSRDTAVALLAVLKAGGAYVPLDPAYPSERLAFMLDDSHARLVLTRHAWLDRLGEHRSRAFCLDADWSTVAGRKTCNPPRRATAGNLAYMIYTSGSTGKPKGVLVPHSGLANLVGWHQARYRIGDADHATMLAGVAFDASAWELWPYLTAGASLHVVEPEALESPTLLVDWLVRKRITICFLPTPLAELAISERWPGETAMRAMLTGGDRLRRFAPPGLPFALVNHYGPTENSVVSTSDEVARETGDSAPPIGRPIANTLAYVLDPYLQPVPVGVLGELYVGGAGLARGYWGHAEWTAERFIPDPFGEVPGARLYKTGDLVRYRPDGRIDFVGRLDHQVKIRGFRIELGEIEALLQGHPAVREAAVMACQDGSGEAYLAAYVVPCDVDLDVAELRTYLKAKLPDYMVPRAFVPLTALPLTSHGKIDRSALPPPELSALEESAGYTEPRTEMERLLAGIWADVLGLERVGVDDNFFEIGGHSLLAARLLGRIREALQVDLPLRALFETPTIGAIAAKVASASRTAAPPLERVSRHGPMPLSFAQQRLWFLAQLAPDDPSYNVPAAIELCGELNAPLLERALNEVVRRHESLRTTFAVAAGQPSQTVWPYVALPLPVVDLSGLADDERDIAVRRLAAAQARRPFDLAAGPLLRWTLLRRGAADHVLAVTLHHIVTDAWSAEILVRELAALYEAFLAGRPSPLRDLPVQYADYASWQRHWLEQDVCRSQAAWWRERLAGLPRLELPVDHPRGETPFRGAVHRFSLPLDLLRSLEDFGRRQHGTLFMTLLAAYQVLLHRYSGQCDFAVGSPVANRDRPEVEGLIGFFLNTLVFRADLSGRPGFREVLRRVRRTALEAFDRQDYPFEKLVDDLRPEQDRSRAPLVQAMFVVQHAAADSLQMPGLTLRSLPVPFNAAKFDLTLNFSAGRDGLSGRVLYNAELFQAETIERMVGHLQSLLQGVLADPDCPIDELPLLSADERRRMLVEWNGTPAPFPHGPCLHTWFEQQTRRAPNAVAAVCEDRTLTYSQLNFRANQLARRLRSLGVEPDERVGVCLERSLDMIVSLLAVLKAGGAYVPLDPAYPADRLEFMLSDAGLSALVTHSEIALPADCAPKSNDGRPASVPTVYIDSAEGESGEDLPPPATTADSAAYVIYTSGSTGKPKGTVVTHGNVARLFHATWPWYRFDERDVWTMFHSFAFDFSVWEIWGALLYGGKLVVVPYRVSRSPDLFYELLCQERVTVLNQTPSAFRQLMRAEESAASSSGLALRTVIFGGEALDLMSLKPWFDRHGDRQPQLVNMYGITETTVHVTYRPVDLSDLDNGGRSVIGRAIPDLELYVFDRWMQPVPAGVAGELFVGGAGVARGYLNRPELTAQRFVPHPFAKTPGERLYKSGDLARYLPDGDLEYLGRSDHQVKIRGFRVELGEIEAAVAAHPGVRESAVLVREDEPGDKRLVAYLVTAGAAPSSPASAELVSALRAGLKEKLPDYMVPAAFVVLEAFPLTAHGKLDRRALPAPDRGRPELEHDYQPPETPLQETLCRMWCELLELDRVGIHDNFFEVGGDSIKGALLINKLQEHLGALIHVVAIFDEPTVAGLAGYLETHYAGAVAKLGGQQVGGPQTAAAALRIDAAQLAQVRNLVCPLPHFAPARPVKNPRAVFVLSPPRSGTTLLRVMLGGHPGLFAPPELELLSFNTLRDRRAAFVERDSFWLEGTLRAVMGACNVDAATARSMMEECERHDLACRDFYGKLQSWIGDKTLVDKTPSYALDPHVLRRAEEDFAEPFYLHLVRHPCAMIRSFEEAHLDQIFFRYDHGLSSRQLGEALWIISQQNILEFLRHIPAERQCRVYFEELVRQPGDVLSGVCRSLGLDFHQGMLDPYQEKQQRMSDGIHRESRMLGDVKFHEHRGIDSQTADRWKEEFPTSLLGPEARRMARDLGYDIQDEEAEPARPEWSPLVDPAANPQELLEGLEGMTQEEVLARLNELMSEEQP